MSKFNNHRKVQLARLSKSKPKYRKKCLTREKVWAIKYTGMKMEPLTTFNWNKRLLVNFINNSLSHHLGLEVDDLKIKGDI